MIQKSSQLVDIQSTSWVVIHVVRDFLCILPNTPIVNRLVTKVSFVVVNIVREIGRGRVG